MGHIQLQLISDSSNRAYQIFHNVDKHGVFKIVTHTIETEEVAIFSFFSLNFFIDISFRGFYKQRSIIGKHN